MNKIPSDLDIAQRAGLNPIESIADKIGLDERYLNLYGTHVAKVRLEVLDDLKKSDNGNYIVVTGITPTPLGEGKTVTTIGLAQGIDYIGKKSFCCIRQPSMGPTFGIKGGAAGGGYSQVLPMEKMNLHLTGDMHAVGIAHNLLSAAIDNRIYHEDRLSDEKLSEIDLKRLSIDPYSISWKRVLDVNDRTLRHLVLGLGKKSDGRPRESSFEITAASEIMAILALVNGNDRLSVLQDLRKRLGRVIIGMSKEKKPIMAEDLKVAGAMAVLLRETIEPNLLQTLTGSPAFVHAGPFANIAHGNSSIIADRIALKLAGNGYVITEAGFGADCGLEKFMNIKCRTLGVKPDCIVMVASVRALKLHGGGPKIRSGRPLDTVYRSEEKALLKKGLPNLQANIEIAKQFNLPVVVAINHFHTDTAAEIEIIRKAALEYGAFAAVVSKAWTKGGAGTSELAEAVVTACKEPNHFDYLYPLNLSIKDKIESIGKRIYGAGGVNYDYIADQKIKQYSKNGFENLPVCMAKTQFSLSHDPSLRGAPRDFILPIKDIDLSNGAGFLTPICGDIQTMPGLPGRPAFMDVDIDMKSGEIKGLF